MTRRAMTIMEVMVSASILTVVLLGSMSAVSQSMSLDRMTTERMIATRALSAQVDTLLSLDRESLLDLFYDPSLDAVNPREFSVEGLKPQETSGGLQLPLGLMVAKGPPGQAFNEAEFFTIYIEARWRSELEQDQIAGMTLVVSPEEEN